MRPVTVRFWGARAPGAVALAAALGAALVSGCTAPPPVPAPASTAAAPMASSAARTGAAAAANAAQGKRYALIPSAEPAALPGEGFALPDGLTGPANAEPETAAAPASASASASAKAPEAAREIGRGNASWYGLQFHGRRTASGEPYNMYGLTAAHRTLPFGTIVRVRSAVNGREVNVRINDRGPFARGRVIDLSRAAADELGMRSMGVKEVVLMLPTPAGNTSSSVAGTAISHNVSSPVGAD